MLRAVLSRLWSAVVGLLMIAVSLFMQMLIFVILAFIAIPMVLPSVDPRISFLGLLLLFNGISCWEYFVKRRVFVQRIVIMQLKAIAHPDADHVSMAMFLVPRGIDRILTGKERLVSEAPRGRL